MNTSANHTSISVKHASSAETNCGRKATKKSDSLGLRAFNSAPLIITRIVEALACRIAVSPNMLARTAATIPKVQSNAAAMLA